MSLISSVTKIDNLHVFTKVGGMRGAKAERIAANGNCVVALLPGNRIWTNWESFRKYALAPGNRLRNQNGMMRSFLQCLCALNLISKAEMKRHLDYEKAATKRADIRSDQHQLTYILKRYGLPEVRIPDSK